MPGARASESIMNPENSVTIEPQKAKPVCPVCGTTTYSAGGIHPQCAVEQADQPRLEKLRRTKAAAALKKPVRAKSNWTKQPPK
jgi:tRNA(Ile2) C34 agmatinyltransferase TiaS